MKKSITDNSFFRFFKDVFSTNKESKSASEPLKEKGTKEFTFIWYKKMELNNRTNYTAPYRTTVWAKNREEAMDKLTNFAMRKMQLVIYDESKFDESSLGSLRKKFDNMSKQFDDMNKQMNDFFK